jgi:hypothetical protein
LDKFLQNKVSELLSEKKVRNKKMLLISVVSLVLILTVSYMTIFPAITMTQGALSDTTASDVNAEDITATGSNAAAVPEATDNLIRTYSDNNVTVQVTLTDESKIPNDAQLVVTPITSKDDGKEFNSLVNKTEANALDDNQVISDIVFYDIGFTYNGENIEPADGTVKVAINFNDPVFSAKDVDRASDLKVLHFEDSGQVEDVTDIVKNADEGVTAVEFSTDSFSPYCIVLADTQQTGNFYQRVSTIDSTTAAYMIVSVQGSYALSSDSAYSYTRLAAITPVKGNPSYYSALIGTTAAASITSVNWYLNTLIPSTSGTSRIQVDATHRLYLGATPIVSSTATAQTLTYNTTAKCWTISDSSGYYLYLSSNAFSRNNSTTNTYCRNVLIYKLVNVTLTIPGDVIYNDGTGTGSGGGGATKPTYDPYITPSGAKSASYTAGNGKTLSAVSDAATSQIESKFTGVKADDGKVVTDKSVIYGADDYGAFTNYASGEFGVTMSALGQEFNIQSTVTYTSPIDVVFILDTSGSMLNNNVPTGESRAAAEVPAVNSAINFIMSSNPNNRVGIVTFTSGSWDFMQLGRYYVGTSGAAIDYSTGYSYITLSGSTLSTNSALRFADTRALATAASVSSWNGTYTQAGIAQAAAMFLRNSDTTYTDSSTGTTVNRTPVTIMLSDGDPTHCTSNYMDVLNGPHYGDGDYTNASNNQGIMGYYTILSANYYKKMVSIHYKEVAKQYSIGLGIYDTGYDDESGKSATGDHYKRCVLNPTPDNITYLNTATSAKNYTVTALQAYQLLQGTYSSSYVTVGSTSSYSNLGTTNSNVPVLMNQYTNYKYTDDAFFGNYTTTQLNSVLQGVITSSHQVYNYGFILKTSTDINMNDPIGAGMEVKSAPILRYGGSNYTCTSTNTTTGSGSTVVTYHYNYTYSQPYTTKTYDLNQLTVTVTTDSSGNQTVNMHIPETALPVYLPDATQSFYYEALPVRLIFKVGMTASALAGAAQNAVFYTNRWDAGVTSTAVFNPTDDNPFYVTATFQAVTENKSVNSSSTLATKYITNLTNRVVTNSMGNNGKLTVTNANCTVSVTVNKVWYQYGGTVITDTAVLAGLPNVTVNLYQSTSTGNTGTIYNTVTFGNSAGWTHTWSNLPNKDGSGNIYYYHVTENTVAGYITVFTNDSGIQSGTINVNNTAGGIILPATGGIGNVPYITGGLTIIIFALLLAGSLNYIKKRKTGRSFERPLDG